MKGGTLENVLSLSGNKLLTFLAKKLSRVGESVLEEVLSTASCSPDSVSDVGKRKEQCARKSERPR